MIDYNGQTATTNNAAGWLSNIAVGDTFQIYKAVGSAYGIYTVSGITTNSTSYILTVSPVSANGNISAGTNIALSYSVKGEQGDPGLNGVDGKRGALGSNDLVYNWMSATNPGGFVGNSTNYSGITTLQINTTSLQGYTNAVATSYNAIAWLDNIKENSIISISDIDASDRFGVYKVSSVTHTESVYTFTVSVLAANGTVDSGQPSHAVGYVKSGSNGNYVDVEDVAPGAGCTYGGVKVTVYDGDTNAVLTTRYICGAEALTPVTPHCWMDFYNDGSNIHLNMLDSGWLNLQGFAHQASQTYRPQVRRIGNVLKFRGSIIVPLEDPQNSANQAIPGVGTYASVAGYHLIGYSKTFTGTGGCTIDTNGAIIFNEGNPVIPIGITSNNFYLERPYVLPFQICDRSIHTGGTKNSTTKIITPGATYGGSLSTVLRLIILADGTMKATTIQDLEQPASAGTTYTGGSSLRTIISKVSETDYVPKFNSSSTNLHGFTTSGSAQNVVVNTNTNGTWLIDFDGGDPSSLGGVIINLDGVVVLLDECIISYA